MDQVWKPKQEVDGALNARHVAAIRLFLSAAALLGTYIDPTEPSRFVPLTYAALIMYTLYSALIYSVTPRSGGPSKRGAVLLVWTDVVVYSFLVSLSHGTYSIFFFFYFFSIITACGLLGAGAGIGVTLASTVLYFLLGFFVTPEGRQDWARLILRTASLLVLGHVLTYWARAERGLRRKLELLREVSLVSNPRFGVDRTAALFMQRLLEFFDAASCALLECDGQSGRHQLRCATAADPKSGTETLRAPEDVVGALQALGREGRACDLPVGLFASRGRLWRKAGRYSLWDPATGVYEARPAEEALPISELLGGGSFIMAPLRHHEWCRGHLFIASAKQAAFSLDDANFLLQVADQVTPVLEHIRLVDCMASDAAEEERRRIARSVHDRVIQPYIGLQMGLIGVRRLLRPVVEEAPTETESISSELGERAIAALDDLVGMTREGIEELRQYVYGLRSTKARGDALIEALLRYAAKFEVVTGIRVSVASRLDCLDINDRLAAEIFQIAAEALSNVQRHTTATSVSIALESGGDGSIAVRIENEAPLQTANPDFLPRSIAEHAQALGGDVQVSSANGRTIVRAAIPL